MVATAVPRLGVGLLAAMVGAVACRGDPARSGPAREELEILSESPDFEGELPFDRVAATEWDDAVVHGDGRTVTITYLGGTPDCFGADHVEAVYEENHVILTLFDGVVALEPNEACTAIGITHSVTVRLSQPVRDRGLVDGGAGRNGP